MVNVCTSKFTPNKVYAPHAFIYKYIAMIGADIEI